jgi:hypothetical protein
VHPSGARSRLPRRGTNLLLADLRWLNVERSWLTLVAVWGPASSLITDVVRVAVAAVDDDGGSCSWSSVAIPQCRPSSFPSSLHGLPGTLDLGGSGPTVRASSSLAPSPPRPPFFPSSLPSLLPPSPRSTTRVVTPAASVASSCHRVWLCCALLPGFRRAPPLLQHLRVASGARP